MLRFAMWTILWAAVLWSATAPALAQGPPVSADTFLQSGLNAGTNFGSQPTVLVGPGSGTVQNAGLIQFDLSGVSMSPFDVRSAFLWVHINQVTTGGSIDAFDV